MNELIKEIIEGVFAPTMATEEDKQQYARETKEIYLNILKRSIAPVDAEETKELYKN